jgi:negative regulator of flagellin synthesis FlgM
MMDPISIKAGLVGDRRLVRVDAAKAAQAPVPVKSEAQPAASSATQLSSEMAAKPPVDTDRVARIKKAIADGKFPTVPATIADRLLALKMEWNPNDKA